LSVPVRFFVAGGIIYLYLLSPSLCAITVAISAVLWAVTLIYGAFARRMQKVGVPCCRISRLQIGIDAPGRTALRRLGLSSANRGG
jgi:hypothetical protein